MTRTKTFLSVLLLLAGLGLVVGVWDHPASAQSAQATRTQQDPQLLQAAVGVGTTATSAATITIPAVTGQYIYVQEIDASNCAGGTAVTAAAPTTMTTTNLTGSPAYTFGSGVTAGLCQPWGPVVFPNGVKSAVPGTAVTFVLPTFATNQTIRVNVAYSYGQ